MLSRCVQPTAALFLLGTSTAGIAFLPTLRRWAWRPFAVGAALSQAWPRRFLDGLSSLLAMTVWKENAAGGR
jgi:hypothetical protein